MAAESMQYVSESVQFLTPEPIEAGVSIGVNRMGMGNMNGKMPDAILGKFVSTDDLRLLNTAMMKELTQSLEERYF